MFKWYETQAEIDLALYQDHLATCETCRESIAASLEKVKVAEHPPLEEERVK
jgi:hypothetical protein